MSGRPEQQLPSRLLSRRTQERRNIGSSRMSSPQISASRSAPRTNAPPAAASRERIAQSDCCRMISYPPWCAIAPRDDYPALERSRVLKRVDDEEVWSVTCFFVARAARRQGVTGALIEAAVAFAAEHGARIVEAYPIDPRMPDVPPVFAWTGLASAFESAGFSEVARPSETRPIMRFEIDT